MSTATREERLARRVADLYATDEQFANARPSEAVTAATEQPGLRLPQLVTPSWRLTRSGKVCMKPGMFHESL